MIFADVAGSSSGSDIHYGDSGYFPDVNELNDFQTLHFSNLPPDQTALPVQASAGAAPTQAPGQPIGSPACAQNQVSSIPQGWKVDDGTSNPNDLLYRIREKICNNDCSAPRGISGNVYSTAQNSGQTDCEIAVAVSDEAEGYFYRSYPAIGEQWQECWDSTENIINKCVNGGPNNGWWNGDHEYQFYQGGFRAKNGQGAKHTPIQGSLQTIDSSQPSPTSQPSKPTCTPE
jgi:hypothetical protein